jgi:hypothetical protein
MTVTGPWWWVMATVTSTGELPVTIHVRSRMPPHAITHSRRLYGLRGARKFGKMIVSTVTADKHATVTDTTSQPRRYRAAPRRGGAYNNTYGDFYRVDGSGNERNPVDGLQVSAFACPFLADLNGETRGPGGSSSGAPESGGGWGAKRLGRGGTDPRPPPPPAAPPPPPPRGGGGGGGPPPRGGGGTEPSPPPRSSPFPPPARGRSLPQQLTGWRTAGDGLTDLIVSDYTGAVFYFRDAFCTDDCHGNGICGLDRVCPALRVLFPGGLSLSGGTCALRARRHN